MESNEEDTPTDGYESLVHSFENELKNYQREIKQIYQKFLSELREASKYHTHFQKRRKRGVELLGNPKTTSEDLENYLHLNGNNDDEDDSQQKFNENELKTRTQNEITELEDCVKSIHLNMKEKEPLQQQIVIVYNAICTIKTTFTISLQEFKNYSVIHKQLTQFDELCRQFQIHDAMFGQICDAVNSASSTGLDMPVKSSDLMTVYENIRNIYFEIVELRKELLLYDNIVREFEKEKKYRRKLNNRLTAFDELVSPGTPKKKKKSSSLDGDDDDENQLNLDDSGRKKSFREMDSLVLSPENELISTFVEECENSLYNVSLELDDLKVRKSNSLVEAKGVVREFRETSQNLQNTSGKLIAEMNDFQTKVESFAALKTHIESELGRHEQKMDKLLTTLQGVLYKTPSVPSPLKDSVDESQRSPRNAELYFQNFKISTQFVELYRTITFLKDVVIIYATNVENLHKKMMSAQQKDTKRISKIMVQLQSIRLKINEIEQKQNEINLEHTQDGDNGEDDLETSRDMQLAEMRRKFGQYEVSVDRLKKMNLEKTGKIISETELLSNYFDSIFEKIDRAERGFKGVEKKFKKISNLTALKSEFDETEELFQTVTELEMKIAKKFDLPVDEESSGEGEKEGDVKKRTFNPIQKKIMLKLKKPVEASRRESEKLAGELNNLEKVVAELCGFEIEQCKDINKELKRLRKMF